MKVQRTFSAATKKEVVRRYLNGESASALAREFSIRATLVHQWKDAYKRKGVAGLRGVGRPSREQVLAEALLPQPHDDLVNSLVVAERRISALEQKLAQQALEIDFFKHALPVLEGTRPLIAQPGAPTSTLSSTSGRPGKARP